MGITTKTSHQEGWVRISLSGRLDEPGAMELAGQAASWVSDYSSRLVLDMSQVEFLGSRGLAVLLGLNRQVIRAGGKLRLVNLSPHMQHLIRIMRLEQVLDCELSPQMVTGPPPRPLRPGD